MIAILFLLIACYSEVTWASMVKQRSTTQTDTKAEYTLRRKRALLEASCAGRAIALTTILIENKTGRRWEIASYFPILTQDNHKVTVSTKCISAQGSYPQNLAKIFAAAAIKFLGRILEPLDVELSENDLSIDFNLKKGLFSLCESKPKLIGLIRVASKEIPADPALLEVTFANSENS